MILRFTANATVVLIGVLVAMQKAALFIPMSVASLASQEAFQNTICNSPKGFEFKGDATKDCRWVALRPMKRCKKKDSSTGMTAEDACPSACNLQCICRNSKEMFMLEGNQVSCSQVTKKDCQNEISQKKLVEDLCPKKCENCFSRDPIGTVCEDIMDFQFKGEASKGCEWVGEATLTRCKRRDSVAGLFVKEACPSVCDLRCECQNSKKKFKLSGGEFTSCDSLKTTDCASKAGRNKIAADFCPRKCNQCYQDVSSSPSETVTETPSNRPTSIPIEDWTQLGSDIDGNGLSGYSVSMSSDGTRVAIGALADGGNGSSSGFVGVYEHSLPGGWTQLGSDIGGEAASDQSGYSVSLSSDGTRVAIGAPFNDGANGSRSGHARVYDYSSPGGWTQVGSDIDGEATYDSSGFSVSMSSDGTRVAIGASSNDGANGERSGHVRVYDYSSPGGWTQVGSDIDGEAACDMSGLTVSMSSDGTRVAIGASSNDGANGERSGHVRVYDYSSPGGWTQVGSDIDGEAAFDESGGSVSISSDGTRVAIGARLNSDSGQFSGHVRVYQHSSPGGWTQVGSDIDGEAPNDMSGFTVSMSSDGTRVAVGAPFNDGSAVAAGHVSVYQHSSPGGWTQLGSDIDGESRGDESGWSVSMSSDGTRVAIGSFFNRPNNDGIFLGHVRVYVLNEDVSQAMSVKGCDLG